MPRRARSSTTDRRYPMVRWLAVLIMGVSAVVGGICGAWMLRRVNERMLRLAIVAIALALTVGLFVRPV
ncbi:hypothetical protein [Lichenifustis flavocetrariae]|uniref:Sulfite exporter TauE/SafE family protein n=1 Tax=Lichenifustis flavocetrariae TaxID=2949735 RepID=A0AA41Z1X9_9HYPH|nr:hypothetical protein [Lichenifustis flavocetrariae]MCW6512726.1 sulfite exporter TauE/SafE family protein [Lichenifustis flavocetrariae]